MKNRFIAVFLIAFATISFLTMLFLFMRQQNLLAYLKAEVSYFETQETACQHLLKGMPK